MPRSLGSRALVPSAILVLIPLLACKGDDDSAAVNAAPAISSFAPASGPVGTRVTLAGAHFTGASAVRFNGTAASAFTVDSATGITATVPSGASTGPLSVTTASGTGTSPAAFTVTSPEAPIVSGFSPASGKAGDVVTVTGSGFASIRSVTLAGTGCAYSLDSGTSLRLTVPAAAAGTGAIAVTTDGGTGASGATFAVQPALAGMNPRRGPVGTPVVFTGTGFAPGSAVSFSGTAATSITVQGANQLTAVVPAGAATGTVSLTANGATVPAGTFTVGAAGTTSDLCIDGMYLVQSIQDYEGSVPLVANRDAVLRVFVKANQALVAPPAVRVTITQGGIPWVRDIAAPGALAQAPTVIDESLWGSSWNLLVPAAQLQPGATILAQANPAGAIPEVDGTNNVFPASGTAAALDVRTVKTFRTTLVPITQQGLTGNVSTGRTPESWVDRFQRMYPILAVDVQVRAAGALATTANLNNASSAIQDGSGWETALAELNTKRLAEASDRYYFGCVNVSYSGGTAGLGYVAGPTSSYRAAMGWDKTGGQDGYNYPEVFAHEVGHNFGRSHAPCGVEDPDPAWPTDPAHADAAIGVYGFDVARSVLKLPGAKDIMSYCDGNLWVSDYTYKAILDFRALSAIGDVQSLGGGAAPEALRECLLVSGRIRNGEVALEPSFQAFTRPECSGGGSFTLVMAGEGGAELQRLDFEPVRVADLPGGQEVRHFALAVPLDALAQARLHEIRVHRGESLLAQASRTPGVARGVRDPVAMAMKPGRAHLSWDHAVHRKVMVRDPRTGEVIAFLEGGSAMLDTDARELEFTFSDGVRSERRMLKVIE